MSDELDEIRRRIDLVDLVSSRVTLKRTGRTFTGLCPFHDDKRPSFTVSPQIGRYKCWSCGASGDAFNWVMETQRLEFRDALIFLAEKAGVKLKARSSESKTDRKPAVDAMDDALVFFRNQLASNSTAQSYVSERGLPPEVLEEWELGYAPDGGELLTIWLKKKGHALSLCKDLFLVDSDSGGGYYDKFRTRLMFPIRNERNELVAFGGRTVINATPKYINSSDTPLFHKSNVLFGMNRAKEAIAKAKYAVLVEGYLDVIACHRAGVKQAVATLGTSFTEEHAKLLKRWCDHVVVLYDSDTAGQSAAEKACDLCETVGLGARVAMMPQGDDPDTLLKSKGPAGVVSAVERALSVYDFRIWLFRQRNSADAPDYWEQAAKVLSRAPNELELLRVLPSFAAEFPGSRDREATMAALRRMVVSAKKGNTPRAPQAKSPGAPRTTIKKPIGPELAVLLGIGNPILRDEALERMTEPGLIATEEGLAVVDLLKAAAARFERIGDLRWISSVEDPEEQELLTAIFFDAEPTKEIAFHDAVERLRSARAKRESKQVVASTERDDHGLREILERMKKTKQ